MYYGYARVSTLGQKDTSIEVQLQYLELQAQRLGYEFKGYYEKASGKSVSGRAVLTNVLSLVKDGDILGVYDNSRLGRNTEENLAIIRNLNNKNVSVQINGKIVDINNPQDKLLFSVESAVSTYQRESQLLKSKAGTLQKKKNGDMVFSGNILGWELTKSRGITTATIKESDAKYIRYVFEEYVKGRSFRSIAEDFENFVDCYAAIDTTAVYRILCKPLYMGYYPIDPIGRAAKLDCTKEQFKENLVKSNVYPPIVSEELWWRAYDLYREEHKTNHRKYNSRSSHYELTSILRCPYCGTGYNHSYSKWVGKDGSKKEAGTYSNFGHKKDCKNPLYRTYRSDALEYVFRSLFFITMEFGEEIGKFFSQKRVMLDTSSEALINQMNVIEDELKEIEGKVERLVDAVSEGLFDMSMIKSKLEGLKKDKTKKESDLSILKDEYYKNQGMLDDILKEEAINKVESFIHNDAEGRRSIYLNYIEKALVYEDKITVEFFNGKRFVVYPYPKRNRVNISMKFDMYYNDEKQPGGIIDPVAGITTFDLEESKDIFIEFSNKVYRSIENKVNKYQLESE